MNLKELIRITVDLATRMFEASPSSLSKKEIDGILGEKFFDYKDIILKSLSSIKKIKKSQGRQGGINYSKKRGQQRVLTKGDKETIKCSLAKYYKLHTNKRKYNKPEEEVVKGFFKWLKDQRAIEGDNRIINSRPNARKSKSWENVDGYEVVPLSFKNFLQFKPSLYSYEVKKGYPSPQDILQAKNYLKFSNRAFLIFKDSRNRDELRIQFKNDSYDFGKLGVYVTKDNKEFKSIFDGELDLLTDEKVIDDHLDLLLSAADKNKLIDLKNSYLRETLRATLLEGNPLEPDPS